jgi:putative signal transducing protein
MMETHGEPEVVFGTTSLVEAEVVKGVLEAAEIPAEIVTRAPQPIVGEGAPAPGFEIRVPADRAEDARLAIAEAKRAGRELEAE